jgi:hypothetical protein
MTSIHAHRIAQTVACLTSGFLHPLPPDFHKFVAITVKESHCFYRSVECFLSSVSVLKMAAVAMNNCQQIAEHLFSGHNLTGYMAGEKFSVSFQQFRA